MKPLNDHLRYWDRFSFQLQHQIDKCDLNAFGIQHQTRNKNHRQMRCSTKESSSQLRPHSQTLERNIIAIDY